jgi:hypothetical protein
MDTVARDTRRGILDVSDDGPERLLIPQSNQDREGAGAQCRGAGAVGRVGVWDAAELDINDGDRVRVESKRAMSR